jgi:hypothetical protein
MAMRHPEAILDRLRLLPTDGVHGDAAVKKPADARMLTPRFGVYLMPL